MKYGYFDNEKREYIIDKVDVPTSWTNYLGVERNCAVVNQTAGGYMFHKSPEHHRMTRFRGNAIPMDRPGFDIYFRDQEDADYWSATWQPVAKPLDQATYRCAHGLSYSRYYGEYKKIQSELRLSIPLGEDVLLWDLKVKNTDEKERTLRIFSFSEFSFHAISSDNQNFQMSMYSAGADYKDGIIEQYLFYEPGKEQYFTASFEPDGFDTLRDQFIGLYHTETNPQAVIKGQCSGLCEEGNNHCGSLMKEITLSPGEEVRFIYMLGTGNREKAREVREKYRDLKEVDRSYEEMANMWEDKLSRLQVQTPNEGMNTLLNTWTLYQSEINVMFSRFASFIETGGRTGLGYRDTAQDAMTIPHSNPKKCKERMIQLLRALTKEGYGVHLFEPEWFDPEAEPENSDSPTVVPVPLENRVHGIDQACSDDALWLVPSIIEYLKETGDTDFLTMVLGYANGGEDSVYDHMKTILEFSHREVGASGICKGLRADWNDCLNLGGGESALVSFLHYWAITNFLELAKYLGKEEDVKHFTKMAKTVEEACKQLWNGKWYLRGYTKDGTAIGGKEDKEGKIHLESNAWAVLSGAAPVDKGQIALDSIKEHLFTPYGIRLNAPAYTVRNDDIGFVTRVCPGLKENSSIFSHPNPWVWAAECKLGNGDQAMEYYDALSPYNQNDQIETRQAEPYSYCQFIMGPDHTAFGRARHPFMTGTGGWAYFSATRYILGIRPGFEELVIDPCIPKDWEGFSVIRKWRSATYIIKVKNPDKVAKGVKTIEIDGLKVDKIPMFKDDKIHNIVVTMG
ncbi:MAG TPA: N,N'-diacetylchitobiose phosphorylase [Candidatus Dorea intestinavium]|nr:N,N'-diacetylchitobiose phosphorylase [Candidatus Dorea intestinavium]